MAGIAALSGVIAAWGAIHYGRQGARNQAKQLQLAQKQAEMRPVLAVAEVRLLEVEALEELREEILDIQEERRREAEREAERNREESPLYSSMLGYVRPPPYKGPLPDKVVEVKLVNNGKTAAYEVTGWVSFEATYLEPLDYFLDVNAVDVATNGFVRAEVGGGERSTLLTTANDAIRFQMAVKVHAPGNTVLRYEFASRAGKLPEDQWPLVIPAS